MTATERLDAWKARRLRRIVVIDDYGGPLSGWRVRLRAVFEAGVAEVEAFSLPHPAALPAIPHRTTVYCGRKDGTPATLDETILAALDRWEELHGTPPEEKP